MFRLDKFVGIVLVVLATAGLDGAADSSATVERVAAGPAWELLPKAPILGRTHEGVVWTGKEMIVWGGDWVGARGRSKGLSDGAAYNPAARRWRRIAPPPPSLRGDALWTGGVVVVWSGNDLQGPSVGAVYDARRDSWRRLPAGPFGRSGREGAALVWTGRELLVIGGTTGDAQARPVAAAVDPRTGRWRLLSALNRVSFSGGVRALWDGRRVVVSGTLALCRPPRGSACNELRSVLLAYEPAADSLRELSLAAAPLDAHQSLRLIGHRGGDLLFATLGDAAVRILRYERASGHWHRSSAAPCAQLDPDQAVSPGDPDVFYVSPCGPSLFYARPGRPNSLAIYSAASDRWREVTAPAPVTPRYPGAVVWTGTQLIAWSGSESSRVPRHRLTPADGAALRLKP